MKQKEELRLGRKTSVATRARVIRQCSTSGERSPMRQYRFLSTSPVTSSAVPSATAQTVPTKRDRHLQLIAERGRMGWQRASGYNWRALVEADIGRYRRVIGDALRSRTEGRQTTEVAIAVASLNRMLELGRPEYVRLT
jgi:hypothetical protein